MADAVVVGSAISLLIEAHVKSGDVPAAVGELVGAMKDAMKSARRIDRAPGAENSDG
jgi:tryptophan synthase alpha subunit